MAPAHTLLKVSESGATPVTVGDKLAQAYRSGMSDRAAAEWASVDDAMMRGWYRTGEKLARSGRDPATMTAGERAMVRFAGVRSEARMGRQMLYLDALKRLALGQVDLQFTREVEVREVIADKDGNMVEQVISRRVERSTRTKEPNVQAIIYALQSSFPADHPRGVGRMDELEGAGVPDEPTVTERLLGEIDRMAERLARSNVMLAAVESPSTEGDGATPA